MQKYIKLTTKEGINNEKTLLERAKIMWILDDVESMFNMLENITKEDQIIKKIIVDKIILSLCEINKTVEKLQKKDKNFKQKLPEQCKNILNIRNKEAAHNDIQYSGVIHSLILEGENLGFSYTPPVYPDDKYVKDLKIYTFNNYGHFRLPPNLCEIEKHIKNKEYVEYSPRVTNMYTFVTEQIYRL